MVVDQNSELFTYGLTITAFSEQWLRGKKTPRSTRFDEATGHDSDTRIRPFSPNITKPYLGLDRFSGKTLQNN
jgi:hypothetical protein